MSGYISFVCVTHFQKKTTTRSDMKRKKVIISYKVDFFRVAPVLI